MKRRSSTSIEGMVEEAQGLLESAMRRLSEEIHIRPTRDGAVLYAIKLGGVSAALKALETVQ